ncbi:LysR family transcriptional regulator [Photobacterium atrarenae]|uniref:LysR family transcriptional regulator n=1 Tax=Photobacterium atrarenae TaxID=865757 RepID=A0ABY5GKE7_9GAMM|nr:LysR family transcriptional regulator [Photobacterium atrarenae]UTV29184.1 LysR family transcriptional regulator [Photobacterium atrarenae]
MAQLAVWTVLAEVDLGATLIKGQPMNYLRRVDLNHLVTMQALLSEKHISRAAVRLNKSQPAVSHSLAYLRRVFDDPLLIRKGGKFELTPKAAELKKPLDEALSQLGTLFEPPAFSPELADRTFRIAMSDYGAQVILPPLLREIRAVAPNIKLVVTQGSRDAMITQVIDGEVDLAFGVFPNIPYELQSETLFQEAFVCVADSATLPECGYLDLSAWLARSHLLVALREGSDNEVDSALHKIGHTRNISMVLPHWGVAGNLVAGTDLILTVAARTLEQFATDKNLTIFRPPFHIDTFDFDTIWHQRKTSDSAHLWLRQMIQRVLAPEVDLA